MDVSFGSVFCNCVAGVCGRCEGGMYRYIGSGVDVG